MLVLFSMTEAVDWLRILSILLSANDILSQRRACSKDNDFHSMMMYSIIQLTNIETVYNIPHIFLDAW
jgi:hypothetical protein